ncbi:MAG: ATP-binding protein, partial [Bryobacterales bacterium]|nr:ATP-binding protein [Bryobacterales bacterium]
MYQEHFALTRFPFQPPEHPDELFDSRAVRETCTRLKHLLQLRGIGLLTGEPGCGKTSATRMATSQLPPGQFRCFYVSLTTGSVLDLYQTIAWAFGLEVARFRAIARRAIRAEISRRLQEAHQLPLLVIEKNASHCSSIGASPQLL